MSKDKIKEVLNASGANKYCVWYYYSTKYKICLLISLFFWEYIYVIIGENNIRYIELDGIDKYCDYIYIFFFFEDLFFVDYFIP